jgi:hypothetical protein
LVVAFGFSALCQQQEPAAEGKNKTGKRSNIKRPSKALPSDPNKRITPDAQTEGQSKKPKDEQENVKVVSIPHVIVEPIRQWTWTDTLPLVFDGLLVIAAFAAMSVGIRTFRAVRRQTAATEAQTLAIAKQATANEESANVARVSTEAMINSERAWVAVKDINYPYLHAGAATNIIGVSGASITNTLTFAFENAGRTIARLTGPLRYGFHFLSNAEALPAVPSYPHETIPDSINGKILSMGDVSATISLPIQDPIDDDTISSLSSGVTLFHFEVALTYYDTFERQREVRFGYIYGPKREWSLIRNEQYNKST